jgi:diguanylate cyclase (GGDEF)-like protein
MYIGSVVAVAGLTAAEALPRLHFDRPILLLAILALGCAATRLKLEVPFPALGAALPVAYGGTLAALMLLGAPAAIFVAIVAAVIDRATSPERPPLYRTGFSIAALVIAIMATGFVYSRLGGRSDLPLEALAGPLSAAVATYLLVNIALVSPAISLTNHTAITEVWREAVLVTGPSYLAGALVTAVFVSSRSPWLMLMACAPLYLIQHTHRIYRERHSEHHRHVEQLSSLQMATTQALARAIDAKDQVGQGHIRRVQVFAAGLARALKMSPTEVEGVQTAAMLHDVGKIGVPDYILSKPGPLTRDEFSRVRRHPEIGADIIAAVPFPYPVAPYIRSHHERWDGSGYPQGLAGESIPLGARILAVVDYYDALVSDRPYHKAMPEADALALLISESGKALDRTIVETFIELLPALNAELGPPEEPSQREERMPDLNGLAGPATGFAPGPGDSVFRDIAIAHREVSAMYEIAHGLGACQSVDDTMTFIESKLGELVPLSACALFLYDANDDTLRCRAARGIDADRLSRLVLPRGAGVNGWVAHHRRPVTNALARWDLQMVTGDLSSVRLRSAAAWPLVVNDRLIGTLGLYHVEDDYYTPQRWLPIDRACEQIAAVVNNALVFERTQAESLTDPLTQLANARQLYGFMTDELGRAGRQGFPVALVIFDLDNFKSINDLYGHDAGNRALCAVARELQTAVRSYDLCARYGGDEFVVVLSGCDAAAAESKRAQICRSIELAKFDAGPARSVRLAVSSGMAVYPLDGGTYESLVAAADRQMYLEKGRRQTPATA